jgi:inositol 1,4,5-triphosphate receptor type 1
VADFLAFFLEDNSLKLIQKNKIICSCLETLVEFCTGYQDNRRDVCNNKRLFSLMNQKLIKEITNSFYEGLNS